MESVMINKDDETVLITKALQASFNSVCAGKEDLLPLSVLMGGVALFVAQFSACFLDMEEDRNELYSLIDGMAENLIDIRRRQGTDA